MTREAEDANINEQWTCFLGAGLWFGMSFIILFACGADFLKNSSTTALTAGLAVGLPPLLGVRLNIKKVHRLKLRLRYLREQREQQAIKDAVDERDARKDES